MCGWNSETQFVVVYPLPSIPIHFQPILVSNLAIPIGSDPESTDQPDLDTIVCLLIFFLLILFAMGGHAHAHQFEAMPKVMQHMPTTDGF